MKQLTKDENGFSAIEIVLVLIIVLLLGVVGWMVYKNHHKTTKASTGTTTSTNKTTQNSQTTSSVSECNNSELLVSTSLGGGAAGNDFVSLVLTNNSSQTCTLDGYPGIQLLDSSRSEIPVTSSHGGGMLLSDPGPSLITVKPGGSAVVGISINEGGQNCYDPYYVLATLPGETKGLTVNTPSTVAQPTKWVCDAISITAFQAGKTPALAVN